MHGGIVYSPLKVLRWVERFDRTEGPLRAPIHVRIKPINACNERCWYCAYRYDDLSLGSDMDVRDRIPREKMNEIVEDFIAMGIRAVTFSGGGEPLIYPYLSETVRALGANGIAIGCLTNGLALQGKIAQTLAEYATWVRISIDAWDGESYARSRRVGEKAFERVMRNARAFASAAKDCTLGFSFIVTRENADHVFDFCTLAKTAGASHVKISACVVSNDPTECARYHEPIAQIVADQIARCRELATDGFKIVDHYHALPERFDRPYDRCPMLQLLTVIGADLNVYTCQDKAYTESGKLGSIADRSFRDFWQSAGVAARVRAFDPRAACDHHCVSHAKNLLLEEFRRLAPPHATFV